MRGKHVTITLPLSLLKAIERHAPANLSDAGKIRFMISIALRHFGVMEIERVQHGGKRPGAGRKKKN